MKSRESQKARVELSAHNLVERPEHMLNLKENLMNEQEARHILTLIPDWEVSTELYNFARGYISRTEEITILNEKIQKLEKRLIDKVLLHESNKD